ncbi:hypothetical protein SSS_04012 [Sarcoptes scabiei]|nr:hypothetical protein SSS_04012 [Sarcoptes scabiei]
MNRKSLRIVAECRRSQFSRLRVSNIDFYRNLSIIQERKFSTSPINKLSDQDLKNEKTDIKTAILMMNMGGPRDENEVQSFLTELFLDRDIIEIPMQKFEEFI